MSFLTKLGLKLAGKENLRQRDAALIESTRKQIKLEQAIAPLEKFVDTGRLERFFASKLGERANAGANQITAALLEKLVDGEAAAFRITNAAEKAEQSGEGFMKKKAAVLREIKEVAPQLSKSKQQLAIELAVQLIKD